VAWPWAGRDVAANSPRRDNPQTAILGRRLLNFML
jgi:hypothetical protein